MGKKIRRVLVWGGGGHGKVVADIARSLGYQVTGYIDRDPSKLGERIDSAGGEGVMLEDDLLKSLEGERPSGARGMADCVLLGIGDNRTRLRCLTRLGGESPVLVHRDATVSASAMSGAGSIVTPRAVINADARIGRAVIVNTGAVIEHDCVLEDGVHVSPAAVLAGGVHAGERSWIGAGAVILNGVRIGPDAIIGAGAVVTHDVESATTVAGVPARLLGSPKS